MEGICQACIDCKRAWSAAMDLSCHDTCEEFLEWEEKTKEKKQSNRQATYIPAGL